MSTFQTRYKNKKFVKERGNDPEYLAARLIQHMTNGCDETSKKYESAVDLSFLGYGICNNLHGDIEYFYAVSSDGIKIFKCKMSDNFDQFRKLGCITFDMSEKVIEKILG